MRVRSKTDGSIRTLLLAVLAQVAMGAFGAGRVAAQWVEAPLTGWAQIAVYHHDTRDEFSFNGERIDIRNGGHAVATSVYVTTAVGVVPGVDAWLQLPFHAIDYTDFGGERERSGIGDLSFSGRSDGRPGNEG